MRSTHPGISNPPWGDVDRIWVSGMTGTDPSSGQLVGPTVQEQTAQALINCVRVVEAGGGRREDVVEVGVLLARPEDFAGSLAIVDNRFKLVVDGAARRGAGGGMVKELFDLRADPAERNDLAAKEPT